MYENLSLLFPTHETNRNTQQELNTRLISGVGDLRLVNRE
jgi:hypothetical protein